MSTFLLILASPIIGLIAILMVVLGYFMALVIRDNIKEYFGIKPTAKETLFTKFQTFLVVLGMLCVLAVSISGFSWLIEIMETAPTWAIVMFAIWSFSQDKKQTKENVSTTYEYPKPGKSTGRDAVENNVFQEKEKKLIVLKLRNTIVANFIGETKLKEIQDFRKYGPKKLVN